ncbi:MAG: hypothetical protein K2O18_09030 [Oscillospiraceae bacterium]|nr:hypothetical protein [Oscillospiraceae bacterium]
MASEQLKEHLKNNCLGRSHAMKASELEAALHVSENELRRQVNRLRRKNVPVCSGPEGYFYAAHAGEVVDTILNLEEMMKGIQDSMSGLRGSLERFGETAAGGDDA